jgi:hypothetical protein
MTDTQVRRDRLTPQAVLGVCIILFGLVLMGDNLGLVKAREVLAYWPVALVALGLVVYRRAPDANGRLAGGFLAGVGVLLTTARVFGWHIGVGLIWPLAFIGIGATMIARALGRGGDAAGIGDQRLSSVAVWSGVKRRITSSLFQYADLTAVMGGIEIDFRQAGISGEAVLDLFVVMGGVSIQVPPGWTVSNQAIVFMGGVEDRSSGQPGSAHRLVLRGFVMMGGVEIKT